MNIDDVVAVISDPKYRTNLTTWIDNWKQDETDIYRLSEIVEKWNSETWLDDSSNQAFFYKEWETFKVTCIEGIHGLTMNERLYRFGLFNLWDASKFKKQNIIRSKLLAPQ